ncbi:MAG: TPM domain-containing protein [Desulfoprunum sp.]|nr:TPM domain-containing protein [Desulfoprunum sp.]
MMQTLAQQFLTEEERQRVSEATRLAEGRTSGEIVPMIVSASHDYPLAPIVGAAVIALPLALLLTPYIAAPLWLGHQDMWIFLALFCLLALPAHALIKRSTALKRLFLNKNQVDEEVQEAAVSAFFSEKLYKTKAENGILIFISVLERRVWVLADSGINSRIKQQDWQEIVSHITLGIREKHQCTAICEAISRVGDILREHFPINPADHNELHNLIIR